MVQCTCDRNWYFVEKRTLNLLFEKFNHNWGRMRKLQKSTRSCFELIFRLDNHSAILDFGLFSHKCRLFLATDTDRKLALIQERPCAL